MVVRDDSAEILFQSFLQEALVSSSGMGRDVHSLMLSKQHFLCRHGVAHPPRCPEGWFWRGCLGVCPARTMRVSVSRQLPEEVPVGLQGSCLCSATSRWSGPSKTTHELLLALRGIRFEENHSVLGYVLVRGLLPLARRFGAEKKSESALGRD